MKKTLLTLLLASSAITVKAQAEPFIGQIAFVAFNFAPVGWAECNGQLLPINQNQALFSLLGTMYGGNGQTTFALPDMRGRVLVHAGTGTGLSPKTQGQIGGAETHTLITNEMPVHRHGVKATSDEGNANLPTGAVPANTKALDKEYSTGTNLDVTMNQQMVGVAGGSQPHNNMQPYLALKCIIATQGIYPSRP